MTSVRLKCVTPDFTLTLSRKKKAILYIYVFGRITSSLRWLILVKYHIEAVRIVLHGLVLPDHIWRLSSCDEEMRQVNVTL